MLNPIKKLFRRRELDCDEVRQRSSDYLEQDLPRGKQSAIYAHLSKCGPCRAFVDTLASTIGVLSRLPPSIAAPTLKQSVLARTVSEHEGKPPQ